MDKLQLLFFFASGFLLSRLIIKVRLPQRLVYTLIGRHPVRFTTLLLYLVSSSALLSFFIPNVITVLTMLPVLELLKRNLDRNMRGGGLATMLALSVIYGANIGGMGSVTASPANAILVGYMEIQDVGGGSLVTFATWLIWGLPLVLVSVLAAWGVLSFFHGLWYRGLPKVAVSIDAEELGHRLQRPAIVMLLLFFLSSLGLSIALNSMPQYASPILWLTAFFTVLMVGFLFFVPLQGSDRSAAPEVLLRVSDCLRDLPWKGFVLVGVVGLIAVLLYFLQDQIGQLASTLADLTPAGMPMLAYFLAFALVTSFTTELLSNTVVQLSLFSIALPLSTLVGFEPVSMLIVVTLSSTSAFMSPLATGVNGLAFGGIQGVSLPRMLLAGAAMNVAGAMIIAVWGMLVFGWLL